MSYQKKRLISLAKAVEKNIPLAPGDISYLLTFEKKSKESLISFWVRRSVLPLSLLLGFLSAVFPQNFDHFIKILPSWTNFSPPLLAGVDYLWNFLGDPVKKPNIIYHLPNIVLYSVGFFGLKKLFDALERHTWIDRVQNAKRMLQERLTAGQGNFLLNKGHSLLFVGAGDYIGNQFALNHSDEEAITISQKKPSTTTIWNYYDVTTMYEDLKEVLKRCDSETAGEYVFFPVVDNEIFLPGLKSYDVSPHKLDILCQDIRMIEKELQWKPKRIIIIGDKFHKSFVQSEDKRAVIPKSQDSITITSIAKKYKPLTILDPTDIVCEHIIQIAKGRKIVFRATKEGLLEYKKRFFVRLQELGYKEINNKKGILTIGYDIFEDQTEQQTLSRSIDDYYPVVLSKAVYDALIRNGYKKDEFLYVPDLVLKKLDELTKQQ